MKITIGITGDGVVAFNVINLLAWLAPSNVAYLLTPKAGAVISGSYWPAHSSRCGKGEYVP